MKATDFQNGSCKYTDKTKHRIEIQRVFTPSVKCWYVSIFNKETMDYTLNQYHKRFNDAKKQYESLCANFPNM